MTSKISEPLLEHRLSLSTLVHDLNADGRLLDSDVARVAHSVTLKVHPLVFLAQLALPDAAFPGHQLSMERLLEWLGSRVDQAVYQIDPLKINVTTVADVMSRAFAERHRILAMEVNANEVIIASAEPFIRSWESNLEHVLRKPIRRVLADPREITRYTAEFYTMAVSVLGAIMLSSQEKPPELAIWSRCWRWVLARSSMPMTSMLSVLSTGCCSTRSNSAPAIFTLSPVAKRLMFASASMAFCMLYTNCRRRSLLQ